MCSVLPVYCQCITKALAENSVARGMLDITSVFSEVIPEQKLCCQNIDRALPDGSGKGEVQVCFCKGSTIIGFSFKLKGVCEFEHGES